MGKCWIKISRLEWKLTSTERERKKRQKKNIRFVDIHRQENALSYKKGIRFVQAAVINNSIRLGVPISHELIYNQCLPKIKCIQGL